MLALWFDAFDKLLQLQDVNIGGGRTTVILSKNAVDTGQTLEQELLLHGWGHEIGRVILGFTRIVTWSVISVFCIELAVVMALRPHCSAGLVQKTWIFQWWVMTSLFYLEVTWQRWLLLHILWCLVQPQQVHALQDLLVQRVWITNFLDIDVGANNGSMSCRHIMMTGICPGSHFNIFAGINFNRSLQSSCKSVSATSWSESFEKLALGLFKPFSQNGLCWPNFLI